MESGSNIKTWNLGLAVACFHFIGTLLGGFPIKQNTLTGKLGGADTKDSLFRAGGCI